MRISAEMKVTLGVRRVGHRHAERMAAGGVHPRAVQRPHVRFAMLPRLDHQLLHPLPHLDGRGGMRQRLAEVQRDTIGKPARHLPEEPAPFEAEDAAPHAVQGHGDDRRLDVLHDALETAAERQHVADARDLAFGEDADDFAVLDGLAGGAQGVEHFARAQLGGNGDDAQDAGKGLYPRQIVDAFVDDEAHMPVGRGEQQHRVHEREVVADKERAAFGGDVVPALHADAIDGMREHPQHETQQGVGQEPDHINGCRQRHQRADGEDAARPEVQCDRQHPIDARRHKQAGRGEQVGRRQHDPFVLLGRPMLEDGGDGDDEEPAEEAQRGDRAQDLAEAERRPRENCARRCRCPVSPRGTRPYSILPPDR